MLHGVSMDFPQGAFTAIVGESGCGKSTVASVLTGRCRGYTGSAALSGGEISALSADSLLRTVTYVGFSSYLFRGTVAENLLHGPAGRRRRVSVGRAGTRAPGGFPAR